MLSVYGWESGTNYTESGLGEYQSRSVHVVYGQSKSQHKMVPATVSFHTLSLVCEGLGITCHIAFK